MLHIIMITGHDRFTGHRDSETITADHTHWLKDIYRNFDAALKIIMQISKDNSKCIICKELSQTYHSMGSIATHYKHSHKKQLAYYFLNVIVPLTNDELENLITNGSRLLVGEGMIANE